MMKRYEAYKDSGIEWIGEIPEHWDVKKLKYAASINDEVLSEKTDEEFEIEYVDISSIESNVGITKTEILSFKEAPSRARRLVKEGDIIVSTVRTYLKAIAKIEKPKPNLVVSTGFAVVRPRSVMSNFTGHLFYHENLLGEIISRSVGVSYPAINSTEIGTIPIPLPSPTEQTAIANYLDRKTAEIDELIADKKRLLELYEEEKTAIINHAVTKGINLDVKMKDSGIEWLGEIPEHWETVSLKWVSQIYSGGTPSTNNEDFWQNGTVPWLNSGTVNQFFITEPSEYITEDALNCSSAKWIPESSIVIALAGQGKTKGMAAQVMFECTCNQSMGVIVPNDIVDNRYLLYYLTINYQNIRNLGGGDKRDGINLEMVGGIPLPIIPIAEQVGIVKYIEDYFKLIEIKQAKTEKLINLLTEYRTALISEVVTGKIKVVD